MPHTRTVKVTNRLARIEGHMRSIGTMVSEGRPCPEVLVQTAAARAALDQAARVLLEDHLAHCIIEAQGRGNVAAAIGELKDALDRFVG
ncbi:MAG: metal-sensing transcriptional repressor [bacterium]|nr:metal-sensing transcriptional repressor [bacterium]